MKGLRTICSECGTATVFQEITIDFERKGVKATVSGVPAMVCPRCGEKYVPGEIAGDVVNTVSRTIDGMGDLMKKWDVL
jgi:YgiT-type zinc finger domain-containing protein